MGRNRFLVSAMRDVFSASLRRGNVEIILATNIFTRLSHEDELTASPIRKAALWKTQLSLLTELIRQRIDMQMAGRILVSVISYSCRADPLHFVDRTLFSRDFGQFRPTVELGDSISPLDLFNNTDLMAIENDCHDRDCMELYQLGLMHPAQVAVEHKLSPAVPTGVDVMVVGQRAVSARFPTFSTDNLAPADIWLYDHESASAKGYLDLSNEQLDRYHRTYDHLRSLQRISHSLDMELVIDRYRELMGLNSSGRAPFRLQDRLNELLTLWKPGQGPIMESYRRQLQTAAEYVHGYRRALSDFYGVTVE